MIDISQKIITKIVHTGTFKSTKLALMALSKQTLILSETTCPAADTPLSVLAALWKAI